MWGPRPRRAAEDAQEARGATNSPSVGANATGVIQGLQIGTHGFGPINPPCGCHDDDEADTLRQMIADGMGQWEASRRLWGPMVDPEDPVRTRAWIVAEFLRAFPWLRLTEGGAA